MLVINDVNVCLLMNDYIEESQWIAEVFVMNISDSVGESSSKRQENGDAPTGSERPLKKARFAWQVKGKYHLKNDNNDASQCSTSLTREPEAAGPSSATESASGNLAGSAEQNLEILGDYLLKQDFNTLDSVIADSEKSLLKPSTSISTESLPYPRYVSSFDNNNLMSHRANISSNEHIAIPMSMIVAQNYTEDQCVARWQARQMAKAFIDNTINRVLDCWSRPSPIPNMDESRFLALDLAEFINNLPGDNSVENEGILMAISAHGLQNTSTSNTSNSDQPGHSSVDLEVSNATNEERVQSPPRSPTPSEDEALEPFIRKQKSTDRSSSSDSLWQEVKRNVNDDLAPFSIYSPSSPSQYFNENDEISPGNEYSDADDLIENHFDFMDTAVSFAIMNKGLTTFGNDYG